MPRTVRRALLALGFWLLATALLGQQVINPSGNSSSGTVTGLTGGNGINVSGGAPSPTVNLLNPFMGVLTIDGVDHSGTGGANATNLCTGLKYINDHAAVFVYKVLDALAYDSEAKDPWNDATCANGFSNYNGALTFEFASMNFIMGWGGTLHAPASSVFIMHGRGSENQLSTANGCGTATPTQCTGTLFAAYTTAAPWTGSFVMTCPGCTVFPTSTPGIDYAGNGVSSFGTQLNGPFSVTMAGIAGSTCIQNTGAQENSSLRDVTCTGAQTLGIDISQSTAQNFHIGPGIEILSGARTGLASASGPGTPAAFVGVKWSVNGPNRDLDNVTCNTRGTATTTSIAACVELVGPGGSGMPTSHVHHIHAENVKIVVLCDGCRNAKIDNINTGSATQDGSTPTAMVYICGAASPAPCTTGLTAAKVNVEAVAIISPSLMPNVIVDDTNSRTITAGQWTGTYSDPPAFSSALPRTEGGLGTTKLTFTPPATAGTLAWGTDNATLTLQGTGTVVNKDSTDSLTNKTWDLTGTGNVFSAFQVNAQVGTYQALAADFAARKTISVASGTFTLTLVASGTQPANGQYLLVHNYGTGIVTIARSGQNINGAASNYTLPAGSASNPESALVYSDGTNYFIAAIGGNIFNSGATCGSGLAVVGNGTNQVQCLTQLTFTGAGLNSKYNNVTTVGSGLVPIYGVVNPVSQTAAISTATLCLAASCGNGSAGQYHVHWNMWGSGTACSSVTAGSVTFLLTWTDENAVTHTAVALQMMGQTGAATEAMGSTFPFQTALANESASGDFTISTNGTIIQYATGYTACTTGTGTYNLRAAVTRVQ